MPGLTMNTGLTGHDAGPTDQINWNTHYAKQELDRLMQAQVLFDNPEEYARNFSACGGEIARLVKPAASTKSGQTPG